MAIKLITFDLDDTLWPIHDVIVKAEAALQAWLHEQHPDVMATHDKESLKALRIHIFKNNPHLSHSPTAMRKAMLTALFEQSGLSGEEAVQLSETAFEYFIHHRNQVDLFDDAEHLLTELKKRFTLGAITNGNADLQKIGLDHLFDFHISADIIGKAKPHPAMFEAALAQGPFKPEETIHIGDHPKEDVAAAKALGIKTIWINHFDRPWTEEEKAHYEADNLLNLLDAIDQLVEEND